MQEFVIVTILKIFIVLAVFGFLAAFTTYIERKILAYFQRRLGPSNVGPFGILQLLADGIKLFTKEDFVPANANKVIFLIAPLIVSVYQIARTRKGEGLDGVGVLSAVKQENERMQMLVQRDNESIIRVMREANSNIMEYVKEYNNAIVAGLGETYKGQHQQLKDIEGRINSVLKSNDIRLDKINLTLQSSMEKLQNSNEKKLEQMRLTVDEKLQSTLEKRISTSFTQVSERLEQVYKGLGEMRTLAGDVGDLKKVLSNVKTRGTWGEVQLGNLLEQMLSDRKSVV